MATFNVDINAELPDRIFVEVDSRFDVAIIRSEAGLELRIYPRTKGELWDAPFATFAVDDAKVIALEQEMEV
jgi:hypothetical protein